MISRWQLYPLILAACGLNLAACQTQGQGGAKQAEKQEIKPPPAIYANMDLEKAVNAGIDNSAARVISISAPVTVKAGAICLTSLHDMIGEICAAAWISLAISNGVCGLRERSLIDCLKGIFSITLTSSG